MINGCEPTDSSPGGISFQLLKRPGGKYVQPVPEFFCRGHARAQMQRVGRILVRKNHKGIVIRQKLTAIRDRHGPPATVTMASLKLFLAEPLSTGILPQKTFNLCF